MGTVLPAPLHVYSLGIGPLGANALLVMLSPDDESDVDGPCEVVSGLDCAPESLPLLLHATHASTTMMSALLHARVNVIIWERIDRDRPAQRPVGVDVEPEARE